MTPPVWRTVRQGRAPLLVSVPHTGTSIRSVIPRLSEGQFNIGMTAGARCAPELAASIERLRPRQPEPRDERPF